VPGHHGHIYLKWMEVKMTRTAHHVHQIHHGHCPKINICNAWHTQAYHLGQWLSVQKAILHTTSVLYHPATNSLVEHAVQTLKSFLKKTPDGTLEDRLSKFLFHYRITPHSTTGIPQLSYLLADDLAPFSTCLPKSCSSQQEQLLSICKALSLLCR